MKNSTIKILFLVSLIFNISCEESNEPSPEVPQNIIDESLNLFNGEVFEIKQESEDGSNAWEIKIQNPDGAIVKFYWSVSNSELIKIEGIQGVFDYELNPGMSLINFSTAKTFAIAAVKNDAILHWELEKNEDFINKWVYEFEFETGSGTQSVYIDAMNGDVLEID